MSLTTHVHPATRTELLENVAVGAYWAWEAGTEHAGPSEAMAWFVEQLDDATIATFMRTAILIMSVAGAQLYRDVWPTGDDDAVDVARDYLRRHL